MCRRGFLAGQCLAFGGRVIGLAIVCCLLGFPRLCASDENSAADGATVFEQFKKFIEDPPPIEDIMFSYQGPPVSRFDPAMKRTVKEPAPIQYYRVQWGPEHVLVVAMPSIEGLEVTPLSEDFELKQGRMVIRDGGDFLSFLGRANSVTYWHGVLTYPADRRNPVLHAYDYETFALFALLNMGPHFLWPGAIRWSENRFECDAKIAGNAFLIEGELFQGNDGLPEKLIMTYRNRLASGKYGEYLVRYFFDGNAANRPSFIPSRVQSVVFQGNTKLPDKDIRILSLKIGADSTTDGGWPADRWISQKQLSRFVYTNQNLYGIEPSGALRLVLRPTQSGKPRFILAHANRYYYVACGLLSAGFLVLNRRMRKQTKQTEQRKE